MRSLEGKQVFQGNVKVLKEENKRGECYKLHKRTCALGKVKCPELLAEEDKWETRRATYNTPP